MFTALRVLDPQMMMETGMTPTRTKADPRGENAPHMMVKVGFTALIEKQAAQSIAKLNLDVEKVFNNLIAK